MLTKIASRTFHLPSMLHSTGSRVSPRIQDATECLKGSVEAVQSLLDQGADINGHNAGHETALLVALWHQKFEVARVLTKYGADVNCRNKTGWTIDICIHVGTS